MFDLQADRPPTYRTHASVAAGQTRYIDSRLLVGKLAQTVGGQRPDDFEVPDGMVSASSPAGLISISALQVSVAR